MGISRSRRFAMTLVAGLGVGLSSAALAQVDVGVNVEVPGALYAPEPVYAAPQQVYVQPPAAVLIGPGWYGDRYYDGVVIGSAANGKNATGANGNGMTHETIAAGPRDDRGYDYQRGEQRGDRHYNHEIDNGRGDH
jgi:hypothetical protein